METYYNPADLAAFGEIGKDAPELAKKFFEYYAEVFKEGELTEREKVADRSGGGARGPVPLLHRRLHPGLLSRTGRTSAEMTEAVHVAAAIRGGASLVHGVQMRKIAEKLSM